MLFYDYLLVVHDVDTLNGFLHFTSHEVIYLVGSCGGSVNVTDASVFTLIEQVNNVYKQLVTIYETRVYRDTNLAGVMMGMLSFSTPR